MKQLGNIIESKDITNKEYVDQKDADIDKRKLEETDLIELPNSRVLELWNQYVGGGEGSDNSGNTNSGSSSILVGSNDPTSDLGKNGTIYVQYTYTPPISENLIVLSSCQAGYLISDSGGEFSDSLHMLTNYILIEADKSYSIITTQAGTVSTAYISLAWYGTSKGFISRPTGAMATKGKLINSSYTAPREAVYARVSFPIELKDYVSFVDDNPTEIMEVVLWVKYNDTWIRAKYR